MTDTKFIGGGFPGIKLCVDEEAQITKESREKREFSVRQIIPLSQLLTKTKQKSSGEKFDIHDNVIYNPVTDLLHNSITGHINDSEIDLDLINAPIEMAKKKIKRMPKRQSKKRNSKK